MTTENIIYSLDEVMNLSDEEIYQRLYQSWNITENKIEVWGHVRVKPGNDFFKLYDSKLLEGNRFFSYPITVRYNIDGGVYINPKYAESLLKGRTSVWVICELVLSAISERKKHFNPFELMVKDEGAKPLVSMPSIDLTNIIAGDVSSYITETLYDFHFESADRKMSEMQAAKELQIEEVEEKREKVSVEFEKLTRQYSELEANRNLLQSGISTQQNELLALNHQYQNLEQEMTKKIERLKSYISEKALFLKDFEFIDEDDFDSFIINTASVRKSSEMLSFAQVFNGDYKQAVSYIQAYLKELDILYPRHIIENYLTLIRSNDLIILAGDSGSGKTNLVQSFARAVGGVSKIIPVKPNWTSSEDLLGYYNPLEKKYLATPFLDALVEAQQNPEVPYFICLDEMNLARVEYYFADFLSKLESRETIPEIQLYSDDESAHVLSELKAVVSIISNAKSKYSQEGIVDFVKLMQDENVNAEMKRAFGFSDKDSLIKYHGDIRRMLSGIISTPSSIRVPANVRIIGAINIDETTHYLSPKILDRAHVMKFKSPLLADWDNIFSEIESYGFDDVSKPLHFEIDALGVRAAYPKFERKDEFCELFINLNREFFSPLGVEFGMRTIRQGLNYLALFTELNDDREQAINNFIIHKVLPKFTFDGNKLSGDDTKLNLIDKVLLSRLENIVASHESLADEFSCVAALKDIIKNAKSNDSVVNYWA